MALGIGQVTLAPDQVGCVLRYDYQAQVSGKLAAIGSRLLEGTIRLVLDQLFRALASEAGEKRESTIARWIGRLMRMLGIKP